MITAIDTAVLLDLFAADPAHVIASQAAIRTCLQEGSLVVCEVVLAELPFDADVARAYGRIFAAVRAAGRSARPRLADLLIASTAVAHGLPLYTRNPEDFAGLQELVKVVPV